MNYKKDGFDGQKAIILPKAIINKFCSPNPVINTSFITDLGYYPRAKFHYRKRPQGSEQNILIYCVEGAGTGTVNDVTFDVGPGDYFVIPSHIGHHYKSDERMPWTIYWCHFKGDHADAIVQAMVDKASGYRSKVEFLEERINIFNALYTNLEKGYSLENLMFVNLLFTQYLTGFLFSEKLSANHRNDSDDLTETAISYMQDNIHKALTLADLATHLNYSASHFSYRFRNKTGFSPIDYFNQLKIQKACQYLQFTDLRVKEIALKVGIDDAFYFTRVFRKTMGYSPKDYRRSLAANKQ